MKTAIFDTRNLIGLIIIATGITALLSNFELIEYTVGDIISLWPAILIFLGIKHLYRRQAAGEVVIGLILIGIGVTLLGKNLDLITADLSLFWKVFWPAVIIFLGYSFISGKINSEGKSNFAIMGGIDNTKKSWELKTGSYFAFMGGIDLDATIADIKEDVTTLDFTAFMGGIDIKIPDDIDVECRGTSIWGLRALRSRKRRNNRH